MEASNTCSSDCTYGLLLTISTTIVAEVNVIIPIYRNIMNMIPLHIDIVMRLKILLNVNLINKSD